MSTLTDTIEFIAYNKPTLRDGEYTLDVRQQVKIDGTYGWGDGKDQWKAAPVTQLRFAVAGPRFSLDPGLIQSQFPPPKSVGEYYGVLPHIILNRTTLPWERAIDNTVANAIANAIDETIGTAAQGGPALDAPAQATPWMALLLFDRVADAGAPVVTSLTVQDLLNTYGQSGTPGNAPEFVKVLPRGSAGQVGRGELKLEIGQHVNDRLTVIDVPKQLLWQTLPSLVEIGLMSHVRAGQDPTDPKKAAEYSVIFSNRLPAPGVASASPVGTQSTLHLVSLEARVQLLEQLQTKPQDNPLVRLVSLASWSFSTSQHDKTFTTWLEEAWCPDAQRTKPQNAGQPDGCAAGVIHTVRMPVSQDPHAERFLAQGYVPIKHQTRQGNHLVSWYRSPLLPGPSAALDVTLPVRTSDELVRYFSDVGMFDTTYAAAWELGRLLTLRSRKVALSLYNWKRASAQQSRQSGLAVSHLPFSPDYSVAPPFPEQVTQWFDDLLRLEHVPFHYLVPREEMLPVGSLRFFHVDINWLACLLDGAFSIGRVTSADLSQDAEARKAGRVPNAQTCSGFLLRSAVVTGWPNLGVEAYTEALSNDAARLLQEASPTTRLRFDRVGDDVLVCLFEGEIKTVDIHEHPETIHFGVDPGSDPSKLAGYTKTLRDKNTGVLGKPVDLTWKSSDKRTLDIAALAAKGQAANSAEFGVTMIEGVEKVRFIK